MFVKEMNFGQKFRVSTFSNACTCRLLGDLVLLSVISIAFVKYYIRHKGVFENVTKHATETGQSTRLVVDFHRLKEVCVYSVHRNSP